ncbi:hypothetical protein U3516DRAFT_792593 [Neocallimastix sp. 'constans']
MRYLYNTESQLTIYLSKQKKFISLVENIKKAFNSKEYKKYGNSFDSFSRKFWNISKAQAYRYLLSAKVLKQLEEFDILPNYERLCKSLYDLTKTPEQIRLLWKTVLHKVENRLSEINCPFVTEVWNELCNDEKYSHICHNNNMTNKAKIEKPLDNCIKKRIIKKDNSEVHTRKNTVPKVESKINFMDKSINSETKISSNMNIISENNGKLKIELFNNTKENINEDNIHRNSQTFIQVNNPINDPQNLFFTPYIKKDTTIENPLIIETQQVQTINNDVHSTPNNRINIVENNCDSKTSFIPSPPITLSETNNNSNSQISYNTLPVISTAATNGHYYYINQIPANNNYVSNENTVFQTIPVTTNSNSVYYLINPPYQQPIVYSSVPTNISVQTGYIM